MAADPEAPLPDAARPVFEARTSALTRREAEIVRQARENEIARRLMTIPGMGPLIATALVAFAPRPETFRRGRKLAALLGLSPRQHSTGDKQRLGTTTRWASVPSGGC